MRLRFRFERTVRAEKDVVVSFFHDVANIVRVTPAFPPADLDAPHGTRVQPGISFTVRMNLRVTRLSWHTRIESLQPDGSFTDIFRGNFFREWRHTHRFSRTGTGTSISDDIECRPVWWFVPFAWLFVRGLFVFRQARVSSLFA
jgi:ligand-binding SRPBCC domain-containing protein